MKYVFWGMFSLILAFSSLNAQVGSFRNINNGDGLLDWQSNCFFKDVDGFIWIGGSYMVERFDGRHIRQYRFPQEVSIIYSIKETKDRTIYAATSNGLFKIDQNSSSFSQVFSTQINTDVLSLCIDSNDIIYAGTQIGLYILSQNKLKQVQIERPDFPFNKVLAIHQNNDGLLWLLTPGGLASYNTSTQSVHTYPSHKWNNKSFFNCMTGIDSILFIGSIDSGILSFDTRTGSMSSFMSVGNDAITSISSDGKSQLFVGTAGTGVFFISLPQKKIIRSFDSSPKSHEKLTSSMVTTLLVDNLGILWVGNSESLGFDYMYSKPKAFSLFKTSTFTTHDLPVHGLFLGKGYKLLTNSYGIYYVSDKDNHTHFFENGIGNAAFLKPGDILSFILYDGNIILGGKNGIYKLDPETIQLEVYKPLGFLKNNTIYHLNTDLKGNLWIASNSGLYLLDKQTQTVRSYNTLNSGLIDDVIRYIYFDKKGRTWICTDKGICFWDDVAKDFITKGFPKDFIDKQSVHFITEDRKGNLLFCYNLKNVVYAQADLTEFIRVCTEEDADFTGNNILKILQDSLGTFWFIGSRGTIKANEELTEFALFSSTEGIMEPYATDGCFDANGNLWLATNKGLFYSSDTLRRSVAEMAITDIKVNGVSNMYTMAQSIKKGNKIVLGNKSNHLEFQFALLTYDRPDLMVYECKLIGFDEKWQILRGLNSLTYKNIEPGNYTFIVRRNMDRTCYEEVHFEIKPFLSKREISIIIFIILGIIALLYRYLTIRKQIKLTNSPLESKEELKYQFNKISENEANNIIVKLHKCMDEKKIYLKEKLKMSDLAKVVGCSNQTLSQVFNIFMNEKYYDFINRYRIAEFKNIIAHTDYSRYTLKVLAKNSGFGSYTSFFRAFKEQTGLTPNEFIQHYESNQS